MIDNLKQELIDEVLRLRKDRSDIQILAVSVRDRALEVNLNLEKNVAETQKLQRWTVKVNQILQLTYLIN